MGARKYFAQAAIVAAATFGAASANATDFHIDPNPTVNSNFYIEQTDPVTGTIDAVFKNKFTNAAPNTIFDDSFIFGVNVLSTGSGSISTSVQGLVITGLFFNGVDYSSALVYNGGGTSASIGGLVVTDLSDNVLRIVGTISGSGVYTGTATVTPAAVPEPATWAMMVVGFGALGAACRRSRAKSTKVAFS